MAKKGQKNRGAKKPKNRNKPKVQVALDADLRFVEQHIANWKKGITEAGQALITLGRDAAYTARKIAEENDDKDLREFAAKLAAIPPQVDTNLDALREQSIRDHLDAQRKSAPAPAEVDDFEIRGGALALFDPKRVMNDLVHHGRPRKDPRRLVGGDVACFGLPKAEPTRVRFVEDAPPAAASAARIRLKVESGVVFVGPPEASDGPRLGSVRKNPFGTALDEHLDRARFMRLKPGTYAAFAYVDGEARLVVHLVKDRDAADDAVVDLAAAQQLPVFVDEDTTA